MSYDGTYVNSVLTANTTATAVTVVIKYDAIGSQIANNSTVTYTGACSSIGLVWTVTGSGVATKFLPKV